MPGVHAALCSDQSAMEPFEAAFNDQKSDSWVTIEPVWDVDGFRAAFSGHPGYPRKTVRSAGCLVFLEGAIYNRTWGDIQGALCEIAAKLEMQSSPHEAVAAFMEASDGDYIVLIFDTNHKEFLAFNDRWGRLPAYFCRFDDCVVFSRTISFLLHWLPKIRFDRSAMAEFLMMGYVLGSKTLVEGATKLPPASVLHASVGQGRIECRQTQLCSPVFGWSPDVTEDEALNRCSNIFLGALEDRAEFCTENGLGITADITAGRDSRAIYVGFHRLGIDATYYSDDLESDNECEYLPALEEIYGQRINKIPLRTPSSDFAEWGRLTYVTDCTVNSWTASLAEYKTVERRKLAVLPAARFMGFGGEFIRTMKKVPYLYRSMAGIIKDDIPFYLFSRKEASRLLGLKEGELTEQLISYFDSYPGRALVDKLKHLYFEYYNVLVNAGENRQRRHFWTISPLWSQDLLSYEMAELPNSMLTRAFFDRFLERVESRATLAPFYRRGVVGGSWASSMKYNAKERIRSLSYGWPAQKLRAPKKLLRGEYRAVKKYSALDEEIVSKYREISKIFPVFNEDEVRKIVDRKTALDKKYHLLTVFYYISEIHRRFPNRIC